MRRYMWAVALLSVLTSACDSITGSDNAWLILRNRTATPIVSVQIDPCGATTPGPNRLGTGSLPSNQEQRFEVEEGCYDVVAVTSDNRTAFWPSLDLEGGRAWTVTAEAE